MRLLLKALVVLVPIALVVGGLRLCSRGDGGRWLSRVRAVDESATLGIDRADLIAIAPTAELGEEIGEYAVRFRAALEDDYGDLVGTGTGQRMVVVIFNEPEMIQEYAGRDITKNRAVVENMGGYTDPSYNAVFVPLDAGSPTLRHELVHLVMETATEGLVRFSPWVMEGLAQYFETFDPPTAPKLPARVKAFARTAGGGRGIDIKRLLRLQDYTRFVTEDGQRNYLEALVLVAFLMEERPRSVLRGYLDVERSQRNDRYEEFVRVVGGPDGKLSADLRRYLGG